MRFTHSERCALKLLRLCSYPIQSCGFRVFEGYQNADGQYYSDIFQSLHDKNAVNFVDGTISFDKNKLIEWEV